jgi:hypothetical protein
MSGHVSWSRRRFLREVAYAGGAATAGSLLVPSVLASSPLGVLARVPAVAPIAAGPVLSFHLDQPYLDITGGAKEYRPPLGARGGAAVAELNDAELSRYYGFI